MRYSLIKISTNKFIQTVEGDREFEGGVAPTDISHKDLKWLPFVEETVYTSTGSDTVKTITSNVVEVNRVVTTTTIRDKTQQELDDEKAEEQENAFQQTQKANNIIKALATALFETINDLREQKGQVAITPAQFKTYMKGKM